MDVAELEQSRRSLLARLDAGKTQGARNRNGQFATPASLASQIVEYAVSLLPRRAGLRFLEPGFGTGAFYSALLNSRNQKRVNSAVGFEVDPYYAQPARDLWNDTGLALAMEDFTAAEPPERKADRFNLVACNPPYVRHHHLEPSQKRELQRRVAQHFGLEMNGLGGLYTYFLVLSQRWMTDGGIGAWLIPSEFMDVNYGRKLKQFLLEQVTLCRIHRFDPNEVQFDDALVSSAVVVFRNSAPAASHTVEFSYGGSLIDPNSTSSVGIGALRCLSKWTSLPSRPPRIARTGRSGALADLFLIKRGLATGCNEFFVLTQERVSELGLPHEYLTPILPSPRYLEIDEICAARNGEPKIERRLFLLGCDLPEIEVRESYPSLWKYLEQGKGAGIHERYLCRHREPWYSQEQRPAAPFLCTYMGRVTSRSGVPFRFILNHSNATAANVYLLLYPKPKLQAVLTADPSLAVRVWEALRAITGDMLTSEGRIYGGGLYKMEPRELANVPAGPLLEAIRQSAGELRLDSQLELFS